MIKPPKFDDEELMLIEKCVGRWEDDSDKLVYMIQVTSTMLDRVWKKCKDYRLAKEESLK